MNTKFSYRVRLSGLALFLSMLVFLPKAWADVTSDKIVAVVNARNPTSKLTKAEIKNIYLGNTGFWNGVVPMKVFGRPPEGPAGKTFIETVLGMNGQRYTAHWSARELAGQGVAPEKVGTADALAEKVRAAPGGIGFMLASEAWATPPAGVKVIELQ
jgi:ABC-type phosphate transport system substrate-binding protein